MKESGISVCLKVGLNEEYLGQYLKVGNFKEKDCVRVKPLNLIV